MTFVIDASIAAAWVIADEQSEATDKLLDSVKQSRGHVPSLFWHEMRNVLLLVERRGRSVPGAAEMALRRLRRLPIRVTENSEDDEILVMARRHRLTAYDASYLDVAISLKLPLATADRRLAAAATSAGVAVLGPLAP